MSDVQTIIVDETPIPALNPTYSIEFFHIYTDEKISPVHIRSMEYLKKVKDAWHINDSTIVLIDEYSPKHSTLQSEEVLRFLEEHGVKPDYWAFEGELVPAAKELLNRLTDKHLEKSYRRYIDKHGKCPCSLLTAAWYLTRLGVFDTKVIKMGKAASEYRATDRLVNILPAGYQPIEARALDLISKSNYHLKADLIQDLFYEANYNRELAIF